MTLKKLGAVLLLVFLIAFSIYKIATYPYLTKEEKALIKTYDLDKEELPEPIQEDCKAETFEVNFENYRIKFTKLASYDITARVEAYRDYSTFFLRTDRNHSTYISNAISPRDLVLSWGDISSNKNHGLIKYKNQNPFETRYVELDIDQKLLGIHPMYYIMYHTSNNHVITVGNEKAEKRLMSLKKGDIVRITGYLVEAKYYLGTRKVGSWGPSSLTRRDYNTPTSCEIIYVENLVKMKKK